MTDYKNLKLIATSSPHIREKTNTTTIMRDVCIALLPALAIAVWNWGVRPLLLTAISVAACVGFEYLYRKVLKKSQTVGDLSAVVTGMLLAFVCPVYLPYWMIVVGAFFAIVVAKQLYGGIGKNFVNPALIGRAALLGCYASAMTTWAAPMVKAPLGSTVDAATAATPMAIMKSGAFADLTAAYSIGDMFIGRIGGSIGEVSAMMLLLGGAYLVVRKVINWHTPAAYILTVAVVTFIFPKGNDPLQWMLYNVLGGGLMLGAIFMATDYATSPVTKKGQLIFGLGCGLLTVMIRYFGSYPEGVCYSILVMNCTTWLIDKYVKPQRFGVSKKEAAK